MNRSSGELMLATAVGDDELARLAREGDAWVYERKLDGYRLVAESAAGVITLRTRSGLVCTATYPEVVDSLRDQPYDDFVVDGEVVALRDGVVSFEQLQQRSGISDERRARASDIEIRFVAFDLLRLDGVDVRAISQRRRRGLLADAFEFDDTVHLSDELRGDPRDLLDEACGQSWEGLIAKRADSKYTPGRSRTWLKLKCVVRQEFVIAGYTEPKGSRAGFGALVVGHHVRGELIFAGRVGTGFDDRTIRDLMDRFSSLETTERPFSRWPPGPGFPAVTWVRPELVCEVGFAEWTTSGQLRHPRYLGLRESPDVADVERDPMPTPPPSESGSGVSVADVKRSNPQRIYYPAIGGTKGEVVAYYEMIAERMLPHIAGRPLVQERYPTGIDGQSFYQKNRPDHAPDWIGRYLMSSESQGSIDYPVIHDAASLVWFANQAGLVYHTPIWAVAEPLHPVEVIWDLDPAGEDRKPIQLAALLLQGRLEALGLSPRVKSTGSKGLHLHVDVTNEVGTITIEEARRFAETVAAEVVAMRPQDFTLHFNKSARRGRLLIDVLRNGHAAHAAAPYTLRAVTEAAIAAPLWWDEVMDPDFDPRHITLRTIAERLADDDPWADHPPPTSPLPT